MTAPVRSSPTVGSETTRRTEILDTAARLFASSGLRTSLKEIADACGILPGSLYHHFESKEALIVELVERFNADLDDLARQATAALKKDDGGDPSERILSLGTAIADCAVRNRAALLLTVYDPPSGAGEQLVNATQHSPAKIDKALADTFKAARKAGYIRNGLDLDVLSDRLCQVLLHISLGVFQGVRGADELPAIRCRAILNGIAVNPPADAVLDRSKAFDAAQRTIDEWEKTDEEEDERLPMLRAVARAEFGRRGYEATTVRDIAAAAGLSTGSVYRLIGSKDELLSSIMRKFEEKGRSAWSTVLKSDSTVVERVDALMWVNINAVERFSDEYKVQLAWIRESPPDTTSLGPSFTARLRDLKALLAEGVRTGELQIEGPSADIRAWSLFELLWMPENIVRQLTPRGALTLARETTLRGAATRA
ncbi:MAG: TetR/AcrR family transcriptional regulator [Actinobacteria bacterium]|nr:TetR/AcrR family transcriptional regulator [Actinomycetota bacterium]